MSLYLYGVVPAHMQVPPLPGVDGETMLSGIAEGPLQAVVSPIDPGLLISEDDVLTIEAVADYVLAHDRTVRALLDINTILPAPFATLLSDEAAVRAMLHSYRDDWLRAFARVLDCVEIGLKVLVDHESLQQSTTVAEPDGAASAGANYLRRKKADLDSRARADRYLNDTLEALHTECSTLARDALLKPIQDNSDDGGKKLEMRAVYLVYRDDVHSLVGFLDNYQAQQGPWLHLVVDGPFAAYHFVGHIGGSA
ncbi:MAG: hypothetical protein GYB67_12085 [Chloroflexi bacterium]|nr:hypothetical protein [Chloroflexota bacterium]